MPIASYLLLPWFATNGGGYTLGINNGVWLTQIYLPATITVSQISTIASQADTGKFYGMGLYNLGGTLVLDSGPMVMSTSGVDELLTATITPTLVPQNMYWLAVTTSSSTAKILVAQTTSTAQFLMCLGTSILGAAANSSSGGQLPSTTGAISTPATPASDDRLIPFLKLQA